MLFWCNIIIAIGAYAFDTTIVGSAIQAGFWHLLVVAICTATGSVMLYHAIKEYGLSATVPFTNLSPFFLMIVAQMDISGRGAKVTMPQKSLDHRQVHPVFQKMAGETVS